jgi:protein required for attachment to host cells
MVKIDSDAWVLVADGEKYLILRNAGDRARPDLRVIDERTQENPATRDQGTDQPGRLAEPGSGRSAIEPTDWHRLEKERFAKDLAERLRLWALDGRFETLVLVADPRTLGVLRPTLHKAVTARLAGEIAKDLTGAPVQEIEAVLAAA